MKMKCLACACAAMLLGSVPVFATNWESVFKDADTGLETFVDTDSIQKYTEHDTRKAWLKFTDKSGKGLFLVAVSKDGQLCLLERPKSNTIKDVVIMADDFEYIEPDTPLSYAYDKIWPVKERKIKKNKQPNRWERKGEDTVERAADRVINRALNRIGWWWY